MESKTQRTIPGRNGGTLTPWPKGVSGNPGGRPRKVISRLQEQIEQDFVVSLTPADVRQVIQSMLEMNLSQLNTIVRDKQTPAFMVVVGNAILHDVKNGNMTTFMQLTNLVSSIVPIDPDDQLGVGEARTPADIIAELDERDRLRVSFPQGAPQYLDFEEVENG